MIVGYARVSTKYQSFDLQKDALEKAGCTEIFYEQASGTKIDREQLEKCLDYIREGDTLVVWKIDRLGRSIGHMVKLLEQFHKRRIEFKSITEAFDTSTPIGKAMFHVVAAFCQMERDLILERTHAGLEAARKRGKKPGNKHVIVGKVEQAVLEWHSRGLSIPEIADTANLSRATLYRYFKARKEALPEAFSKNNSTPHPRPHTVDQDTDIALTPKQ